MYALSTSWSSWQHSRTYKSSNFRPQLLKTICLLIFPWSLGLNVATLVFTYPVRTCQVSQESATHLLQTHCLEDANEWGDKGMHYQHHSNLACNLCWYINTLNDAISTQCHVCSKVCNDVPYKIVCFSCVCGGYHLIPQLKDINSHMHPTHPHPHQLRLWLALP